MAQTLTPFRYESQAQRHCPGDTIVWLDFGTERYYLKGQRRYASGYTGSFVCRNEARDSGYRRSLLGLRKTRTGVLEVEPSAISSATSPLRKRAGAPR